MSSAKCFPLIAHQFVVTSPFNAYGKNTYEGYTQRVHKGIDLDVTNDKYDKTIVASTAGVVKIAGWKNSYGNCVWILNDDGKTSSIYCHLSKVYVKVGQTVGAKTPLGLMGNTGDSRGEHLHFGVSYAREWLDFNRSVSKFINPAIYWGIDNYYKLKGRVFSGEGMITGTNFVYDSTKKTTSSINNSEASTTIQSTSGSGSSSYGGSNYLLPSGEYFEIKDLKGVTADWLYGRRYRCFVDLGNGRAFDVSNLRCVFEIKKSVQFIQNASTISIYNLNPDDENKIIKNGQRIVLEAGYQGEQYGKILDAQVIQPIRSKENQVDYKLTLVSRDCERYATYGLVGVSLVAQQSMRDAISALSERSTVKIETGLISDARINYPRGKVMFGKSTQYMEQIAKSMNATYYNEDGMANIVNAKDFAKGEIVDLSPETGLIGSPEQSDYGIQCECLLNPRIKLNSLIHVDNRKVIGKQYQQGTPIRSLDREGIYRVTSITYTGDTRGTDWKMKIETISQAGILPGMFSGNDIYGW